MNDYLERFQELEEKDTFRGQQWFGERSRLVDTYSWAVPSEDAVVYLAEFDHIIEIGAGSGYWAKCIEDMGGSVRATDISPPDETWVDVEQAGESEVDLEDAAVLMVWPPYNDRMSVSAVKQEPNHILYVGEPEGGCTGHHSMFPYFEKEYGLVAKVEIPSYAGIKDNLFHYIRKV